MANVSEHAFDIRVDDLCSREIRDLIAFHQMDLFGKSPPGTSYTFDLTELASKEVTVWSVWENSELVGCGALKEISPLWGEVKSMRTATAHLRKGVAATLLDHIIKTARTRNYIRLSLETGTGEEFEPAATLYRKRGFKNGEIFGEYEPSPHNQFMHLDL